MGSAKLRSGSRSPCLFAAEHGVPHIGIEHPDEHHEGECQQEDGLVEQDQPAFAAEMNSRISDPTPSRHSKAEKPSITTKANSTLQTVKGYRCALARIHTIHETISRPAILANA